MLMVLSTESVTAQNTVNSSDFWSRMRYGGGIGLGFGRDSFNAQLAPSALYQANPYFATGLGLNFNYAKFGDAKFTAYGASVITLFNPIPQIQLSAEFEELRVHRDFGTGLPDAQEDYWLPALFAGIGYGGGNVTIGIRYDLLYDDEKSIYANAWMPFVRFYF
jgi:long-subunit fatty acid transport protein